MKKTPDMFKALKVYNAFVQYVCEWQVLECEYNKIPSWRTFKQLKNIRRREKLTKAYVEKMREWGIVI